MVQFPKRLAIDLGLGDIVGTLKQSKNEEEFGIKHKDERTLLDGKKHIAPYSMDLNRVMHTFFMCYDTCAIPIGL